MNFNHSGFAKHKIILLFSVSSVVKKTKLEASDAANAGVCFLQNLFTRPFSERPHIVAGWKVFGYSKSQQFESGQLQ